MRHLDCNHWLLKVKDGFLPCLQVKTGVYLDFFGFQVGLHKLCTWQVEVEQLVLKLIHTFLLLGFLTLNIFLLVKHLIIMQLLIRHYPFHYRHYPDQQ